MSKRIDIPLPADTPLPPITAPSLEEVPPSFNQERPTPLDANMISARTRPRAVVLVYAIELVWALLIAAPVHAWARRVYGTHPDGDAVLWAPGGRELLGWLGGLDAAFGVTMRTSILLLVIGAVVSQVLTGALLVSLGTERPGRRAIRARTALAEGINLWLPMTCVLIVASAVGLALLGAGVGLGLALDRALIPSFGDATAFKIGFGLAASSLLLACLTGVYFDLVRAAIAREATVDRAALTAASRLWSGFKRGAKVGVRSYVSALREWSWRAAASFTLLGVGWLASSALGGKGGFAVVALFVVHQAIVMGRIALRASYFARTLRIVG